MSVTTSVPLERLPDLARIAWIRLRDDLLGILGDDLVAMWAYGGTTAVDGPPRSADLDTHVIVHSLDARTGQAIEGVQAEIASDTGVEWDNWYVLEKDACQQEAPRHAYRTERVDTSWAIHRAHWLAGHYSLLYGRGPAAIVPPPTSAELEVDLDRELEHLEAHVAAGDTDPYEATYAILNGSRLLRAIVTGDVATSKRSAGPWAIEHLQDRWHPTLRAALRAYNGQASPEDTDLLARKMAPFVAMVRQRLPPLTARGDDAPPRWSGC